MNTRKKMGRCLVTSIWVACLCLALPVGGQTAGPATDELAAGIRQVHEGEFDAAVVTLDGVVRRFIAEKASASQIAKAHVYLAISYMGLAQVEQARVRFIEALRADKTMELSPKEFPPNVIELFAQVKREELKPPKAPPVATATPAATPKPAAAKASKGSSKVPFILLGVGAAGGGAVAIAAAGGGAKPAPTPVPTPIPTPTPVPTCTAGQVRIARAVFEPPTTQCPRGSHNGPYATEVVADVRNDSPIAVSIDKATVTVIMVKTAPNSNGGGPQTATSSHPYRMDAQSTGTIRVPVSGTCTNEISWPAPGVGFMEFEGTITINTSCGDMAQPLATHFKVEFP
jgi:hypothetical protein